MKNEKNKNEMNFIPNKHELYLFNRGKERDRAQCYMT